MAAGRRATAKVARRAEREAREGGESERAREIGAAAEKSRARGARRARALSLGARLRERTIYFSARLKVSFSFAAALVSFSLAAAALAVAISSSFLRFLSTLSGTSGPPFFAGAALAFAALAGIVGSCLAILVDHTIATRSEMQAFSVGPHSRVS